jgi:hypothetical protein
MYFTLIKQFIQTQMRAKYYMAGLFGAMAARTTEVQVKQ